MIGMEKESDRLTDGFHLVIDALKLNEIDTIYNWKSGETLIFDRTHLHSSSSNLNNKKLGLVTFTKK